MKYIFFVFAIILCKFSVSSQDLSYKIVDTKLETFYNNLHEITEPGNEDDFFGQDAHYKGFQLSYTNNKNGTITDNVSGLMWQKNMGEKTSFEDAFYKADTLTLGGFEDWRVPTLKELYSLILFNGITGQNETNAKPYIDTGYFDQPFGNSLLGERHIDAQTWSSTEYIGKIMNQKEGVFGVNFIDGRIKAYPKYKPAGNSPNKMYFRMVRGNKAYGLNKFTDNKNGTISDLASGLMWQQSDNGETYDWQSALEYAENLELADYSDWRLPNAKELQSIVDYSRCPDITNSAAINTLFGCTEINDPNGNPGHYGFYWTGTTHHDGIQPGKFAVYVAFGEAQGIMNNQLLDVHGAGAQRGDPKSGNREDYPQFFGPQGDVRYVYNFVRCVRTIDTTQTSLFQNSRNEMEIYPNPFFDTCNIVFKKPMKNTTIELRTSSGSKIKTWYFETIQPGNIEIKTDKLVAGLYLLHIHNENYKTNFKMIKKL